LDIFKNYKLIIFQLLPFILGWLINHTIVYLPIYVNIYWVLSIGFILYWFWVGKQFGQLRLNKILSVFLGNIIWAISVGLFIWQFIFVDELNRNLFLAVISQYYGLFTILFSTKIVMLFKAVIDSNQVMITSYTFMFIIYLIGFIYGSISVSRTNKNNNSIERSYYRD